MTNPSFRECFLLLTIKVKIIAKVWILVKIYKMKKINLLLEVSRDFVTCQRLVSIGINLGEDVDGGGTLLHAHQLHVKVQSSSARDNIPRPLVTVAEGGGHYQPPLLAGAHAKNALFPALDDLSDTDLELEGLSAVIAGVELLAVLEGAGVVHLEQVAVAGRALARLRLVDVLNGKTAVCYLHK